MATLSRSVPSPGETKTQAEKELELIVEFWNRLRVCEDLGTTNWEALEPIEREVTDCLSLRPPDLQRARTATARALDLILGRIDL
ncbi:hypothetical protein [Candidatus Laterigemmans baculatus]|uniref:hypothetical protein n=1 Tax=Candidatus Laterigemmans baculatus TaxID=2770505 RepID=UPI0013D92AC8|nr:hypothetical protein [Candidatus Laterigemmans baculatus]